MAEHVLDRPVWSALASVHRRFAVGGERALRFESEVSPFGATCDESPQSLAELARLVAGDSPIVVVQANPVVCPDGLRISGNALAAQMVFEDFKVRPERRHLIERLGEADVPAMIALAGLTRPGPFAARTYLLGEYWGAKQDGRLIAMAGERLKQPGHVEVSGVCTHPDFQGRGLAGELCVAALERITGRGEVPYLHAYTTNTGAIRLYEKLGFRLRKTVHVAILQTA